MFGMKFHLFSILFCFCFIGFASMDREFTGKDYENAMGSFLKKSLLNDRHRVEPKPELAPHFAARTSNDHLEKFAMPNRIETTTEAPVTSTLPDDAKLTHNSSTLDETTVIDITTVAARSVRDLSAARRTLIASLNPAEDDVAEIVLRSERDLTAGPNQTIVAEIPPAAGDRANNTQYYDVENGTTIETKSTTATIPTKSLKEKAGYVKKLTYGSNKMKLDNVTETVTKMTPTTKVTPVVGKKQDNATNVLDTLSVQTDSKNATFSAMMDVRMAGNDSKLSSSRHTMMEHESTFSIFNIAIITASAFAVISVISILGTLSVMMYRRYHWNKPQTLSDKCSNADSSGYIDDNTFKENSEEMYSLDNDSFLNSLEAMTIQNYWADSIKHTKL